MRALLTVVALAAAGCASVSARRQAENELLDCVYRVNLDENHDRIMHQEADFERKGCEALFHLRLARLRQ